MKYKIYNDVLKYVICNYSNISDVKDIVQNIYLEVLKKINNMNMSKYYVIKIGAYMFDADIKEIPNNKINIFNDTNIPKKLDKFNGYSIYTRKDRNAKYDILNCYVYSYFNDNNQSIRIAFSNTDELIRDYYLSDESGKYSTINGFKLKIYQYENNYMTKFKYKDYNFDIETNDITIQELINLLESIIK